MRISRLATRECSVADLPYGLPARVVAIDEEGAQRLLAHGVMLGALVSVEADAPFGGPRIVRLGAARVALARSVARTIHVRPEADPDGVAR